MWCIPWLWTCWMQLMMMYRCCEGLAALWQWWEDYIICSSCNDQVLSCHGLPHWWNVSSWALQPCNDQPIFLHFALASLLSLVLACSLVPLVADCIDLMAFFSFSPHDDVMLMVRSSRENEKRVFLSHFTFDMRVPQRDIIITSISTQQAKAKA